MGDASPGRSSAAGVRTASAEATASALERA